MKEIKHRTFYCEQEEFKKKLGLPEGADVVNLEVSPNGDIQINMMGVVQ